MALYINSNNDDVTYFDSFGVEYIPKDIKTNIFRIQACNSIMCRYFCIGFIDFMLVGKTLTEYTNLFSLNNFKENDGIILNYFVSNISNRMLLIKH